jgi:hypothetical protein
MRYAQSSIDKIVLFLIGSLGFLPVHFVGTMGGGEVLALILLPLYFVKRFYCLKNPIFKKIFYLLVAWFLAQLVSDVVNQTEQMNSLKGLAHIGFVITSLIFFTLILSRNCMIVTWYFAGTFISALLNGFVMNGQTIGSMFIEDRFWYSSVAPYTFPLILLSLCYLYPKSKLKSVILLGGYGFLALLLQGRSDALISILGSIILASSGTRLVNKISLTRLCIISLGGLFFTYGIFLLYVTLGLTGHLGAHSEKQLAKLPDPYSIVDTILVGRSESFFAFAAIADKPLLGHGSGAERDKYISVWELKMSRLQNDPSIKHTQQTDEYNAIPTHSVILYGWVFSGIIGGICWIMIFYYVIKTGLVILRGTVPQYVPLAAVFMVLLSWHLLFSPHGHARFTWPPYMGFAVWAYYSVLHSKSVPRHLMLM